MKNNDISYSKGGQPVYKHEHERAFEAPSTSDNSIETIKNHIQKHIGESSVVFHELISDLVHIDIHLVPPTPLRNYYTLVTSGMSDMPMNVPEGAEDYRYAELVICLPPEWKLSEEDCKNMEHYWPIYWLKKMARFPHKYNTWLWFGHTVPNGIIAKRFARNTKLSCMMVSTVENVDDPEDFFELKVREDKTIYFYSLLPIYKQEMTYKLHNSVEALLDLLESEVNFEVVDINRKNTCKKPFFSSRK